MTRARWAEPVIDGLTLAGAAVLFVSLFLTWSHQLPSRVRAALSDPPALRGVPSDPTAWQVYSVADVLLAALIMAIFVVAVWGASRRARVAVLAAVALALAFTAHAESTAPTNGVLFVDPQGAPSYLRDAARPGAGETVAMVGLGLGAAGLMLSFPRPR